MNLQDCIKFTSDCHPSYFATFEEGQPRVRPMGLWFADEKGFYYQSHAEKVICKQLKKNNRVEACWFNRDVGGRMGTVMRVAGEVEFLDDLELKKRVYEDRPHIVKSYGLDSHEDPRLVVFRIYQGEAYFWSAEYNLRESDIEKIQF